MRYLRRHGFSLFLAALFAVVCGWQMLLPGYIFLLDWVYGPEILFKYSTVADMMNAPSNLLIFFLALFLPGWFVQKLVFFLLLFALFYVPIRLLRGPFVVRFFGALFFAMNPFVYERLLAGQWRVLFGYICCFVLVLFLVKLRSRPSWFLMWQIVCVLLITGIFSAHFFVIGVCLVALWWLWHALEYALKRQWDYFVDLLLQCFSGWSALVLASFYWIVPYGFLTGTDSAQFGVAHQSAFETASGTHIGPLLNVIFLHGFWGEAHPWAQQYILPKEWMLSFILGISGLLLLLFLGLYVAARHRKQRLASCADPHHSPISSPGRDCPYLLAHKTTFLLFIGLLSLIFSVGTAPTVFVPLNAFLFEHVLFWSGFRDAQKWVGVFVIVWVLIATVCVHILYMYLQHVDHLRERIKQVGRCMLWVIPIASVLFTTPQMLWGLWGQASALHYPLAWEEARHALLEIEARDADCQVLFLPWHQYYGLRFTDRIVTANVGSRFFPCRVITGHNTGLRGIEDRAPHIDGYQEIAAVVTSNDPQSSALARHMETLKDVGMTHIIFTDDLVGQDAYLYPFLASDLLQEIYRGEGIILYAIR